jgi:hypothetical protein
VKSLYGVWIKVDETLPWIELKGSYQTRKEGRKAAKDFLSSMQVKIVPMPESRKQIKALATIRR